MLYHFAYFTLVCALKWLVTLFLCADAWLVMVHILPYALAFWSAHIFTLLNITTHKTQKRPPQTTQETIFLTAYSALK